MPNPQKTDRENWSGRLGFILAATGSAIGLGNLWKFPYITWKNGGGIFILIYLICIVFVGFPIMVSEIVIGKLARKNPYGSLAKLGSPKSPYRFMGLLGIISAFTLLSYYSVIAGWGIEYEMNSIKNKFDKVTFSEINRLLIAKGIDPNIHAQDVDVQAEKNSLERITQTIRNSSNEILVSIKTTAFREAILGYPDELIKKKLLADAKLLPSASEQLTSAEIDQTFEQNKGILIEKIRANHKLEEWSAYFFDERVASPDYQDWLQRAFLPAYSSFMFSEFSNDPHRMILWHGVIMLLIFFIASRGIRGGVELASKIGMSVLLVIMLFLMVNSILSDPLDQGVKFLVWGDASKLSQNSFLEALGHAFFTLSLGLGVMITYGSYLKRNSNVVANAAVITLMDTLVALVSCLMIFPIIFSHGFIPTGDGIGILFTTLPLEFAKFPGGRYLSILFYFLVLLAAVTSAISLLEVVVTYLQDEFNMGRFKAALLSSTLIFLAGLPSAINLNFLEQADLLVSHILLPLGGLFIAVFVGYRMDMKLIEKEFRENGFSMRLFTFFKVSIKYISPLLVALILIQLLYSDLVK